MTSEKNNWRSNQEWDHRKVGRHLRRFLAQCLAQNRITNWIRLGFSELYSVRFWKPPRMEVTHSPWEKVFCAWLFLWWKRFSLIAIKVWKETGWERSTHQMLQSIDCQLGHVGITPHCHKGSFLQCLSTPFTTLQIILSSSIWWS